MCSFPIREVVSCRPTGVDNRIESGADSTERHRVPSNLSAGSSRYRTAFHRQGPDRRASNKASQPRPHYAEAQRNSRRAGRFWSPFSDSVSSSHWSKAHRAQSYCHRHIFGISIVPSRTWQQSLASRAKDLPLFPKVASIVITSLRVESTHHGLSTTWLNRLYCNRNARRSSKTHNFMESLSIGKKRDGREEVAARKPVFWAMLLATPNKVDCGSYKKYILILVS